MLTLYTFSWPKPYARTIEEESQESRSAAVASLVRFPVGNEGPPRVFE